MARRESPLPSPVLIVLLAAAAAACAGLATAVRPAAGMGLLVVALFVPVALLDLRLALVLWTPVLFIRFLPAVWIGPTFVSLILLFAWIGEKAQRGAIWGSWGIGGARAAFVLLGAFLLWMTLTIAWVDDFARLAEGLYPWYVAALVVTVVATTLETDRHARLVAGAFVVGAVLSVAIGLVSAVLGVGVDATFTEGRLEGGSGDPNYLAAGLVPAMALAGGLAATTRSSAARWWQLAAIAFLGVGLGATQSRGGLVAAIVAGVAALFFIPRVRAQVLAGLMVVVVATTLWLLTTPGAAARVLEVEGGGTGRADLWRVALRVAGDHPVVGAGITDFASEAVRFVREPGQLEWVELIAERPHVVHNSFLQVLAETGSIGLVLYLATLASFLALTFQAGSRLAARGDLRLAVLARALFVGQLGALTALFFVSYGEDARLWLLLGIGVALHAYARREPEGLEPPAP
jgi:O-antigen ligase